VYSFLTLSAALVFLDAPGQHSQPFDHVHHVHATWNSEPLFTHSSRERAIYLDYGTLDVIGRYAHSVFFIFLYGIIVHS